MYGLNMDHIKFVNITEDKFQDQQNLIKLTITNGSTINDAANMKNKTPNKNTSKWNLLID